MTLLTALQFLNFVAYQGGFLVLFGGYKGRKLCFKLGNRIIFFLYDKLIISGIFARMMNTSVNTLEIRKKLFSEFVIA